MKGNCYPTHRDANEHQVGAAKSQKLCIYTNKYENIYVINTVNLILKKVSLPICKQ